MKDKVEYDNHCAFAVSTGKTSVHGGAHYTIINGRKFAFSNPVAKLLFRLLPDRIIKADQVWEFNKLKS